MAINLATKNFTVPFLQLDGKLLLACKKVMLVIVVNLDEIRIGENLYVDQPLGKIV